MAKARRHRARDTWKEKEWYMIKTPKAFGDKDIGETPARDPDFLIKRGVEITLRELTGDFSKQYIKLKFEVDNVVGKIANTVYTGHTVTSDYVRSMIRRGTSRIDATVVAKSNDDHEIKLHVLAITTRRSKSSQQKYMREMIQDIVKKSASYKNLEELIETSVNGRLASDVYHKAKKIYPLKRVEVIKSKVIK